MQPMSLGQNQLQVTSTCFAVHEVKSINLTNDKISIVTLRLSYNGDHFPIECIKLIVMHLCKLLRLNFQGYQHFRPSRLMSWCVGLNVELEPT